MSKRVILDLHILKSQDNIHDKLSKHILEIQEELDRISYDEITVETTIKQMTKAQLSLEISIRETLK